MNTGQAKKNALANSLHVRFYNTEKPLQDLPVLVFLHDALGSVAQWNTFPEQLCHALKLQGFAYDRYGHGLSPALHTPRRHDYLHLYAYEELPAVLEQHLPGREIILVGHSDGGSIALLFAARYPSIVKALVSIAAHVRVEEITLQGIRQAELAFRDPLLMDRLARYHGTGTRALFEAWWKTWLSDEFSTWNIEADIQSITCPVLALQGDDDEYGTADQVQRIVNGIKGYGEQHLIPKSGHAPWKTQPENVIPIISAFFSRLH